MTFRWLPPGLRPPVPMDGRQEHIFLLVGAAALFAGYDQNVFGLAIPQIQASLHIPENQVGLTVAYFRVAAIAAMLLAASADVMGRRRLLLLTILGQAAFTLLTAFTTDYASFVWAQVATRIFGYAEEMLCFVVIGEEVAAGARGWASGTLSAFDYLGAGVASLVFAAVNLLPYGWRAIYVIGALPLFLVAYLRRRLPETRRFAALSLAEARVAAGLRLARDVWRDYPLRVGAILVAAAAFGFAIAPATVLGSKYLQSVYGYSPGQTTLLFIPGGLIGLGLAILAGRLSDAWGRKRVALGVVALAGAGFFLFYSGAPALLMPPLWVLAFFGFFSGDALIAGFALEIVPTRYRATVSGLRYLVEIGMGALSLALEGVLYDIFRAHGPAVQWMLAALPLTLAAILLLPEPAGKSLEELS
jgi:putative MFS transporter